MADRRRHLREVVGIVQEAFGTRDWTYALPSGSGHETYIFHSEEQALFVKVGAQTPRVRAMAEAGLTPPVLVEEELEDGLGLLVQPLVEGRKPSPQDLNEHLEQAAEVVGRMHGDETVQGALPGVAWESYREAGERALARLRERWGPYRGRAGQAAIYVDRSLDSLEGEIEGFTGEGLVASHNDICNDNWLLTPEGRLYLVDLDMMELDDPACDTGIFLWWYYPPEVRRRFLEIAGYEVDEGFETRMRVRAAMHCLRITLPREDSFDTFQADYASALGDFEAAVEGRENPRGFWL